MDRLAPIMQHLQTQIELTIDSVNQQERAGLGEGNADTNGFRQEMLTVLNDRLQIFIQGLSRGEELRQLIQSWVDEFESTRKEQRGEERLQFWLDRLSAWGAMAWRFEVLAVEDAIDVDGKTITGKRSITVGKIVLAIAILVIGYLVIATLTRWALAISVKKLQIDITQARIARKWILALSFVLLLLGSLAVVKIPLAVFAFLGGAIAIGAGFGMQTLLKNLISGLMLLMERPFRPGDFVEVGSVRGAIVDINVRSCTVRDVNGIDTLIPNSTFIEQNVTNWTLSTRDVRFDIKVGVAYGTPVEGVIELLLELAERHPQVRKQPKPEALFEEFGDNSLLITLYVWLEMNASDRPPRKILSELRQSIAEAFQQRDISIAFPQCDVHLDARNPLQVHLVSPADKD